MTEGELANHLAKWLDCNHKLIVPNALLDYFEADLVAVSKSLYLSEYEIKVAKSDLEREFKCCNKESKRYAMESGSPYASCQSYYWLAVHEPLAELALEKAKPYMGVISVDDKGWVKVVRKAKRLPGAKPLNADKLYFIATLASRRLWGLRTGGFGGRK
jgi:hypothetical protein